MKVVGRFVLFLTRVEEGVRKGEVNERVRWGIEIRIRLWIRKGQRRDLEVKRGRKT